MLSVGAAREEGREHSPRARRRRGAAPQCRRGGQCRMAWGWARPRRAGGLAAVAEQRPRRYSVCRGEGGAEMTTKKREGCICGARRLGLSLARAWASSWGGHDGAG